MLEALKVKRPVFLQVLESHCRFSNKAGTCPMLNIGKVALVAMTEHEAIQELEPRGLTVAI